MFNKENRKQALRNYEINAEEYEKERGLLVTDSEELYATRLILKEHVKKIWEFLNNMRNKPEEVQVKVEKLRIEFAKFENFVKEVNAEVESTLKKSAGSIGTGIAAGAGVAAFGPAAAMAIATTFGTASTGTAISALSGAAATNAALAWLGGGALVAGGGGTAAGTTLLALSGPIGWTIGGISLVGAGIFTNSKNKKMANEAREKALEIKKQAVILKGTREEIKETTSLTQNTNDLIEPYFTSVFDRASKYKMDYNLIKQANDNELVNDLGSLINQAKGATELLNRAIGQEA
ncbi:DNA polymerase III subunit gamma/tau [Staphylococcus condimenti]|uniref:DNA polymerase III subunit gamma/tau n=1 Tax=Staphylococcus condimenti TaxID=70255 RepID=A0AB37GYQ9_9STAP|nr:MULTISPECIES: hypothetical protein [Staphylococcus]AMY05985.1 hypothetical protein A4G25_08605 [Staphylococcus condimenti]APR59847.1 hypothetical protein BTZ13_00885 [Staphylococcus condimenti]MDK8644977.1 DNA polymerase III subunit gamma/tau [Staphylococcus condimenti]OFP02981.1 hypothetical protein HMPREF3007_08155 [Staphylococcus sp. HMSC065E08]PNZ57108.1 DNA polymerase III subunit gamma/tau [Staphylococcus condimenti]